VPRHQHHAIDRRSIESADGAVQIDAAENFDPGNLFADNVRAII